MAGKYEFNEPVGQVAAGNIQHEGRSAHATGHVSNVVSVRINAARASGGVKYVTRNQRRSLWRQASELAGLRGEDTMSVFQSVIFPEFGISSLRRLRRSAFRAAAALLDQHIAAHEARGGATPHLRKISQTRTATLDHWLHTAYRMHRWTCLMLGGAALVVLALAASAVFFPSALARSAQAPALSFRCAFEGRGFTVGSIVKMPGSEYRECLRSPEDGAYFWGVVRHPHTRGQGGS